MGNDILEHLFSFRRESGSKRFVRNPSLEGVVPSKTQNGT